MNLTKYATPVMVLVIEYNTRICTMVMQNLYLAFSLRAINRHQVGTPNANRSTRCTNFDWTVL